MKIDIKNYAIETTKFLATIVIIILICFNLFCLQIWWKDLKTTPTMNVFQEPSESEFAEAYKRHGICWSFNDGKNYWFFDKDGKKCLLFKKNN